MKLIGARTDVVLPSVPVNLRENIRICTTCELSSSELDAIERAFLALMFGMNSTPPLAGASHVAIVITDQDAISLSFADPGTLGVQFSLIVLAVHRWRAHGYDTRIMTMCCLEELCHFFWDLPDGYPVQLKVTDLMQALWPGVRREQLYRESCPPPENP